MVTKKPKWEYAIPIEITGRMLHGLISADPVYQILKLLGAEKESRFQELGMDQRDITIVLKHIHQARYANRKWINSSRP
ncbi:hypothetical protein [Paenibacillus sp. FSL R10-2771]|jgi:hypothetical protein|uniref:hypothetical protein n=1 Tax=Paenibacillus sp. FSL R10-2771 TaxID=2954693 RepID=UPI0004F65624|nr:hypothetical protein P40081_18780 [Paenibacillus sp. FSL P4-0081]OMF25046.1 hypothetical protein BK132_22430 [Paenibacillus sp. FSL H8-0259]